MKLNQYSSYRPRRKSYKPRKYHNNRRTNLPNRKKKTSFVTILLYILLFSAVAGLVANVIVPGLSNITNDTSTVTVYMVPSEAWSSDGSNYGAWCWNNNGVPEAAFVLGTDKDNDGIIEFNVSTDYSRMLFVDLIPESNQLGEDWCNKRQQTDNLSIPTGKNVYYHQSVNEWSDSPTPIYYVTTDIKTVFINTSNFAALKSPVVYYFDKTGTNDPNFILMTQCGDATFTADIPAGYTHVIFIDYSSEGVIGSWNNIINQTEDLLIPTDNNNLYDTSLGSWTIRD